MKGEVSKPVTMDEFDKKFDTWWAKLPADAQEILKKAFGGSDGFSYQEKKQIVEYVASQAGWEDDLSKEDIDKIKANADKK